MNTFINREIKQIEGLSESNFRIYYNGNSLEKTILTSKSIIPTFDNYEFEFERHLITSLLKSEQKDRSEKEEIIYGDKSNKVIDTLKIELTDSDKLLLDKEFMLFDDIIKDNIFSAYIYERVFICKDNKKSEVPLFFAFLKPQHLVDKEYEIIKEIMTESVYDDRLNKYWLMDFGLFLERMNILLTEFFDLLEKTEKKELLFNLIVDIEGLVNGIDIKRDEKMFLRSTSSIFDESVKVYVNLCIESFLLFIKEQKIVKECSNCRKLFLYKEDKKYCSQKCLKASANKRNYKKRKLKSSSEEAVKEYKK